MMSRLKCATRRRLFASSAFAIAALGFAGMANAQVNPYCQYPYYNPYYCQAYSYYSPNYYNNDQYSYDYPYVYDYDYGYPVVVGGGWGSDRGHWHGGQTWAQGGSWHGGNHGGGSWHGGGSGGGHPAQAPMQAGGGGGDHHH
jgi:hypothetical protein